MREIQNFTLFIESVGFENSNPNLVFFIPKVDLKLTYSERLDVIPRDLHDEIRPGCRLQSYAFTVDDGVQVIAVGNETVTYFLEAYQTPPNQQYCDAA